MTRIILVHGLVAGLIIIAGIIATIVFAGDQPHGNIWLGFLIMFLGMSAVFVGVKQYRDQQLGGVIRFWPAWGVGLAIALIAALAYVLIWEVYLAMTGYQFMEQYAAADLAARRVDGLAGQAYSDLERYYAGIVESYRSPLYRLPMTFSEIAPVGVIVSFVSAVLLRNARFLPARTRA